MTHDEQIKALRPHGYLRGVWYCVLDLAQIAVELFACEGRWR